jgi:hypothetical protein
MYFGQAILLIVCIGLGLLELGGIIPANPGAGSDHAPDSAHIVVLIDLAVNYLGVVALPVTEPATDVSPNRCEPPVTRLGRPTNGPNLGNLSTAVECHLVANSVAIRVPRQSSNEALLNLRYYYY